MTKLMTAADRVLSTEADIALQIFNDVCDIKGCRDIAQNLWIAFEKGGFEGMCTRLHDSLIVGERFGQIVAVLKRRIPDFTAKFRETARLSPVKIAA